MTDEATDSIPDELADEGTHSFLDVFKVGRMDLGRPIARRTLRGKGTPIAQRAFRTLMLTALLTTAVTAGIMLLLVAAFENHGFSLLT